MRFWLEMVGALLRLFISIAAIVYLVKFCIHGDMHSFQWFVINALVLLPNSKEAK